MSNCKTIAVCNQKGGVGKTTTTVNLGVGLAMQGKKVLLIDADPQGDLTTCLGWQDTDGLGITLATKLTDVINETMIDPMVGILHHEEGVDLVPANLELSAMEFNLVNAMSRETTLKNYLSQVKNRYDYVIIDCMPSLGMVTLNALSAADSVIIPVQAQYLPAKGMTQLVQTISKVKKYINPDVKIDGMLLTLVDSRTNLAKSTVEALRANFGNQIRMYRTQIPIAIMFDDPFERAEEERLELEREELRQCEIRKARIALSMLQPLQRERLMKNVCCGLSSRVIAKQEGVYYSSVDKSIAAAKKNFIKFYENL